LTSVPAPRFSYVPMRFWPCCKSAATSMAVDSRPTTTSSASYSYIATDDAYFKFNLDYMSFYNLVRLESSSFKSFYQTAYRVVRSHTASHQNAFFDIIDRALEGVNATRDTEPRT